MIWIQTLAKFHADLQFDLLILFLAALVVGAEWVKSRGYLEG